MAVPVDLKNLRDMIGEDKAIELDLFKKFSTAGTKCLALLETSCAHNDHEQWRSAAHAFKGIALNLGAFDLGALCDTAQSLFEAEPAQKTPLLSQIHSAFASANAYLCSLHKE